MKSIGFAVALAGVCLLAGSASAQTRYASRGDYDQGPVRQVGFHHGYYNEIEAGGCCGPAGCGGCRPCCRPCVLPCVLRAIGRAVDCLLPCGRCCHGGCGVGCGVGCRTGCCGGGYVHGRPPLYGGHHSSGCASCGGGDEIPYSAPYAPPMKADPFQDDIQEAVPTPAPARANPARSNGSSRIVRPSRTASVERPQYEGEQPVKRIAASKPKQIVGTGVAKVVHEEPVVVNKPVTSLKNMPRDNAPAPPALLPEEQVQPQGGLPKNPLRR